MLMKLRFKLTLFTVSFVLLASMAILAVSVFQIRQKEKRDISTFRANELRRLQNNLQSNVDLLSSAMEDKIGTPEMPSNLAALIKKLKSSTNTKNTDWVWLLDTGNISEPVVMSLVKYDVDLFAPDLEALFRAARDTGTSIVESQNANPGISYPKSNTRSHYYWYARAMTHGGWVLAAGAPLKTLDAAVNERIRAIDDEITRIIKDRINISLLFVVLSAVAIILFSKIITDPVNRLVELTERIADGSKGYNNSIEINSRDEIGRLAASFNAMLKQIQNSMDKLEETASKYRELVENANSAIIHIDYKGKVLFINEFAQNLFGYSPNDVVEKNIAETIGKPVDGENDGADMFTEPQKYPYLERVHLTSSGNRIWVGWANRPIFDKEQKLMETLCVGSDITKSKEAEELAALQQRKLIQADKMATLGILVSGIAHEINNPNNYIILNAQTLADIWKDIAPVLDLYTNEHEDYAVSGIAYIEVSEEIPGMLKGIADGALRIKNIVQSLKDFSRMEPDDMNQKVDVAKVLDAAQIIVSNMIKKCTESFSVEIESNLPLIRGNFQRVEQVLLNLLTNACQAVEKTKGSVSVRVQYERNRNEIIVRVIDNGSGIKSPDMKRIFDPFFTTKREIGGTGLGLAVSYSIIKDHGGELKIDSKEGLGTIAIMTLPCS
jgi:PAS domain S-box-containing protein